MVRNFVNKNNIEPFKGLLDSFPKNKSVNILTYCKVFFRLLQGQSLQQAMTQFIQLKGEVIDKLEKDSCKVTRKYLQERRKVALKDMMIELDKKVYLVSRFIGFPDKKNSFRKHQLVLVAESSYCRSLLTQFHRDLHMRSSKLIEMEISSSFHIPFCHRYLEQLYYSCPKCAIIR